MTAATAPNPLGTLEQLPIELRMEVYQDLCEPMLKPVHYRLSGQFWHEYAVDTSALLISHQISSEIRDALRLIDNRLPPTVFIQNSYDFDNMALMDILKMARGFDVSWLRTHGPAEKAPKVADWVIDNAIHTAHSMKTEANGRYPWLTPFAAPKGTNMRRFLEILILRLRNDPKLQLRVISTITYKSHQEVGFEEVMRVLWSTKTSTIVSPLEYSVTFVRSEAQLQKPMADQQLLAEYEAHEKVGRLNMEVASAVEAASCTRRRRWPGERWSKASQIID